MKVSLDETIWRNNGMEFYSPAFPMLFYRSDSLDQ
jgi:hypothetical protein